MAARLRGTLLWALCGALLLALAAPAPARAARPTYVVVDHATGEVLGADGADEQNYPASLTKMMTLYLTFEALRAGRLRPSTPLRVSAHAAAQPPSKLGLRAGSRISVDDAIQALTVKSANDVAVVLAEALGGSEERFALQMTRVARLKGLRATVFRNAHGLPNAGQVTTARDIATLARRLIADFPQYYHYFSRPSFAYAGRTHGNHNRLLATYPGMDGLKTGFIRASGFNLAASAVRGDRRLVGVVLGGETSSGRNALMARVLDQGFATVAVASRGKPAPVQAAAGAALAAAVRPAAAASAAPVAMLQAPGSILAAKPLALDAVAVEPAAAVARLAAAAAPGALPLGAAAAAPVAAAPPSGPAAAARAPIQSAGAILRAKPLLSSRRADTAAGPTEQGDAPPGLYAVQVGAYVERGTAARVAAKAAALLPKLGGAAQVNPTSLGGKKLYAARLSGLSQAGADRLCGELKRKKQPCFIVRPATGVAAAALN